MTSEWAAVNHASSLSANLMAGTPNPERVRKRDYAPAEIGRAVAGSSEARNSRETNERCRTPWHVS